VSPLYEEADVCLYQGNCLDILPYLPIASAIITDPPFAEATHAGARSHKDIDKPSITFASVSDSFMRQWLESVRCDGWIIATIDWRHMLALETEPPRGLRFVRFGVWVKPNGAPQFTGDRPATGWEAVAILHRDNGKMEWNGGGNRAVWTHNIVQGGHPTEKPEPLIAEWIRLFTNERDLIVDPFCGRGTVLAVARRMNRRAIGIECDPRWCEATISRLSQQMLPMEPEMPQPVSRGTAMKFGDAKTWRSVPKLHRDF
jgi:site-specific DNA-methyltransferase (adenine-specific)